MIPCKKCGSEAILVCAGKIPKCSKPDCWEGPLCLSEEESRAVWNKLMGGKKNPLHIDYSTANMGFITVSEPEPRRPVAASFENDCVTAVCSDGSLCCLTFKNMEWRFLPPIPGTPADPSGE
jgi:hypothetical protein